MTKRFAAMSALDQLQALSKFKDDVLMAARTAGLLERKRGRQPGVKQGPKRRRSAAAKPRSNGKATNETSTATTNQ